MSSYSRSTLAQSYGINLSDYLGLHFFLADNFNPAQLFTYMFMHGGFQPSFQYVRSMDVRPDSWTSMGTETFLFYYILCGVGAGLLQEVVQYIQYVTELSQYTSVNIGTGIIPWVNTWTWWPQWELRDPYMPSLLAFGMLFPTSSCSSSAPFPIKAKFFVIGYALIELYAGLPTIQVITWHTLHLGGMIFGFILIMYWRKRTETMGHII